MAPSQNQQLDTRPLGRVKAKVLVPILALAAWIAGKMENYDANRAAKFRAEVQGFINLGSVTGILTTVILGIVILLIIANLAGTFITAVADLVQALESGTTNNTTADTLLPVFGLLIALGGVFALVGYAFLAYRRRSS